MALHALLILHIAAASDLQPVLGEIKSAYEKRHPEISLQLSYGASGTFAAQIAQSAPFDVFFSADTAYCVNLAARGFVEKCETYARGRLALWLPKTSPIIGRLSEKSLVLLADPAIHKIAIADPAHAPYGKAAMRALESEKLLPDVKSKLVAGENVSQAAQFSQSGAADAGLIALSLASSPAMSLAGVFFEVPAAYYPVMDQAAGVLKSTRRKKAADDFLRFVLGKEGKSAFKRFGYGLAGN